MYALDGVFPQEADYFELSDQRVMTQTVNTNALVGAPGCPHCGAQIGFAVCACGGLHCLKSDEATCPWCGVQAQYQAASGGGMDITRARG